MPTADCVNTCGAGCGAACSLECADICSSSCRGECISECGSGCAASATTPSKFIDPDHITNDFMLEIIRNVMRYIILLGNKSDIITSAESLFSVIVEPMYYVVIVTCTNTDTNPSEAYPNAVVDDNGGVLHKYENVFRINRVNNETTVTNHDYIKFYSLYESTVEETVGNVVITHYQGSRVVKQYTVYTEPTTDYVNFYYNGIRTKRAEIRHAIGDPCVRYKYYDHKEYDEHANLTNDIGDIYVDENGQPVIEGYDVTEYDTHWVKLDSRTYRKDKDTDSWVLVN